MKKLLITLPVVLLLAAGCNFLKPAEDNSQAVVQNQSKAVLGKPTLTLVEGDQQYIEVTWDTKVSGQFTVYRSVDPSKGWDKLVSKFPGSAHTALDYEYPKDAAVVYYRVTTFSAGQESKPSETASIQLTSKTSTDDWKTYSNSTYNFSLMYPSNWTVQQSNDSDGKTGFILTSADNSASVAILPKGGFANRKLPQFGQPELTNTTFGGISAQENQTSDKATLIYINANMSNWSKAPDSRIDAIYGNQMDVVKQILQSFKFTK